MAAMGFVTDYLNSPRMAQDLSKVMHSNRAKDLFYVNEQMIWSMLRWRQFFENPYVDRDAIQMEKASYLDFCKYRSEILHLFTKRDISEDKLNPRIQALVMETAKKLLVGKNDLDTRFVTLLTMAATEYHGFNEVFADRIRKYGLNPNTKFYTAKQIAEIEEILSKADKSMGKAQRDQKMISVTPDPRVAARHARMSPEWFYFFSIGSCMINTAYLNRDYNKARNQLLKFDGSEKLSMDDRVKIIKFFEQWWAKFATQQSPKIAVMPMFRDHDTLQMQLNFNLEFVKRWGFKKTIKDMFNGAMYHGYEHRYSKAIAPKFLEIVDLPTPATLAAHLRNLRTVFHRTHLKLERQYDKVIDRLTPPLVERSV